MLSARCLSLYTVGGLLGLSLLVQLPLPASAQAGGRDRGSKEVLAPGSPPLTRGTVTRVTDFIEWVLEATLTEEQRGRLQAGLVEAWQKHSLSDIDGTAEILKADAQVAPLTEAERAVVRQQLQPEVLKSLRADANDEFNKWLLAIYDSAHAQIAEGSPPLTRQASDAQAEMFAFMLSEASGQHVSADRQFKEDWARQLVAQYPKLPAERQKQWAQSPIIWASLRVIWAKADEKERARLRKSWAEALPGAVPQARERAAVEASLKDVAVLLETRKRRPLTPAETERAAKDLTDAAKGVRTAGGEQAAQQAAELEQMAATLKQQAAAPQEPTGHATSSDAAPRGRTSGKLSDAAIMEKITSQHSSFMSLMNTSMQVHYTNFNSIATMGGSPYRYVNAYGNPY